MICIIKDAMTVGAYSSGYQLWLGTSRWEAVRTAITKRINRSTTEPLRRPHGGLGGNDEVPLFKAKLRVSRHKIDVWRYYASFERKHCLNEACQPSSSLQMSDVGLDAADV